MLPAQARRTRSPGALVVAGEAVAQAHGGAAVLAAIAVNCGELVPAAGHRAARPLVHFGVVCRVARLRIKITVNTSTKHTCSKLQLSCSCSTPPDLHPGQQRDEGGA